VSQLNAEETLPYGL